MRHFVDLLGRIVFGGLSVLGAVTLMAVFAVLAMAQPANIWQNLARYVLMDLCVIVVIFLLLAAVKFWSSAKWVDVWLASYTLKAGVIIMGFAVAVLAVGIFEQFAR